MGFLQFAYILLVLVRGFSPPSTLSPINVGTGPLSCDQVWKVVEWGNQLNRFGKEDYSHSQEVDKRGLQKFLDKIDPLRVTLLKSEEDAFINEGLQEWNLHPKSCRHFEKWLPIHLQKLKRRAQSVHVDVQAPEKIKNKGELLAPDPFLSRPKNTHEQEIRFHQLQKKVVTQITAPILAAYSGDVAQLVSDTLKEWLFDEDSNPHSLMAKGLLEAIDPYSTYFPPTEYEDFVQELSGSVAGIGVRVIPVAKGLMIETVLPQSPASKNGKLHRGQVITQVGDQKLKNLSYSEQRQLLKGIVGSRVKLKVWQPEGEEFSAVLVRKEFQPADSIVRWRLEPVLGESNQWIALLTIPNFYGVGETDRLEASVSSDVERALNQIRLKIAKKSGTLVSLILDLRGNPGGYLDEAVTIAGFFLGNQPIVQVVEKKERRVLYSRELKPKYQGPLVVWVDDETASAAEVLAVALKDYQRALVIGDAHTYGKGSVQKLFPLGITSFDQSPLENMGSGAIKVTTSTYYSPLGTSPNKLGMVPHLTLSKAKENRSEVPSLPKENAVLEKDRLVALSQSAPVFQKRASSILELPRFNSKKALNNLDTTLDIAEEWAKVTPPYLELATQSAE